MPFCKARWPRDIAAHSAKVLHNDLQGFELDEAAVLALMRARAEAAGKTRDVSPSRRAG